MGEDTPRTTDVMLTDYERSKVEGETEARRLVERGLDVVIVNPTRVYGPGLLSDGNSVTKMVGMFLRGRFPFLLGEGTEIGNYVFVDDVARGHIRAMEQGRSGERYLLAGENASLVEFFGVLGELTGRRPPRRRLPGWLARTCARLDCLRARAFGGTPMITPEWVDVFLRDWEHSNAKAVRELGCTFRGLRDGLATTCEWLQARHAEAA
jgi:farnesol dehydrogenase